MIKTAISRLDKAAYPPPCGWTLSAQSKASALRRGGSAPDSRWPHNAASALPWLSSLQPALHILDLSDSMITSQPIP